MLRLVALLALSTPIFTCAASVTIDGRKVLIDGEPRFLKGINWNPVPKGGQQKHGGVHFRGFAETDSTLMAALGVNALRTYEPINDTEVLDILWSRGIHVLNTVYISGDSDPESAIAPVRAVKDHPAIFMWVIGNEWNYNMLYSGMMFPKALKRVGEVARLIKSVDTTHPVATVYGMMPGPDQIAALDSIDVWGLTAYTGISFGNLFDLWRDRSDKPMFVAEYGADAYNSQVHSVDEKDQATATVRLTREIMANSVQNDGVCLGGFIFELADEWWKDGKGSPDKHDAGGVAPGGGPFPDFTFNEEYWGIVTNDGTPRQAYTAYAELVPPGGYPERTRSLNISVANIPDGYRLQACGSSPACNGMIGNCCPTKAGEFRKCCNQASKKFAASRRQPKDRLAPWTPEAHAREQPRGSQAKPAPASGHCAVDAPVPCCPKGRDCGSCAGDQCCPSKQGSVTCPSASKAIAKGCIHPKLYDCTGKTGTSPPNTTTTTRRKAKRTTTTRAATSSSRAETSASAARGHRRQRPHETTTGRSSTSRAHEVDQEAHAAGQRGQAPDGERTTTKVATTTEIIQVAVHTTMKSLYKRATPGAWVLGPEKSSCDAVCADAGGCAEGGWPTDEGEFMQIANSLGYACFDLQEGGGKYNPSSQQGNCGWSWDGHNSIFSAGDTTTRCAAQAPAFTRRFCPCKSASTGSLFAMSFQERRLLRQRAGAGQSPPTVFL
mmetsp:Transcript_110037/g.311374  ORF Transcript_110037/g.311374 Transcript_110037/m.311374 type:complete len:721 (-) Transcript_110037:49-2211(-)